MPYQTTVFTQTKNLRCMKKIFTLITALFAFAGISSAQDNYIISGEYNGWSLTENCITFTEHDGGYTATVAEFKTGQWGFKILKNPETIVDGQWTDHQFGIAKPIATNSDEDYSLVMNGNNIYIGAVNNDVTLHNVTFEFYPSADGTTLDYFSIKAEETITVNNDPQTDEYMMVGSFQGWSFENNPLVFESQGDNVYTASIDKIYGDWKIVKNRSWDGALGGGGKSMEPGNTYNLVMNGDNTGFAAGVIVNNAKFTLTVAENGNATIKVEGTMTEEHSFGLVGAFQGWNAGNALLLEEQEDGSWTKDITAFPGGKEFKVSIDKTWTCFLAQDAPTALSFNEPYTCARGDNNNNFTIGDDGIDYNVHVKLVVAEDAQSAELTITDTDTGITMLSTKVATDAIYNVAGQRVHRMQKGINIINGKKILR